MHHPTGVLALFGAGIRRGVQLRDVSTLDVAPTILTLLGVPVPSIMRGRVLREAWRTRSVRFTHDAVSAA
jgi:predicted AlkP superfamily phosphohydrolase/phosphomutase